LSSQTSKKAGDDGRTRYTIDVRPFLVAITAVMAMSFGAGVACGPSPSSMTLSLTDLSLPAQGAATPVQQHRRLPTTHSAELGKKILESHVNFETPVLENMGDGAVYHPKNESGDYADDNEHLPAGQHLLVDIKNIEAAFLNSESRLTQAKVDVVKAGGFTLLSYHCHSFLPRRGLVRGRVLLESHNSFHTWLDEGVITLDLFTFGSSPMLPVVPISLAFPALPTRRSSRSGHMSCAGSATRRCARATTSATRATWPTTSHLP
jgi:S-adenosylmethionine decarboxylase